VCEATVYVEQNGRREKVLKDVIRVEVTEGGVVLTALLEPPQTIQGTIREVDLLKHSVTLIAPQEKDEPKEPKW